MVFSEKTSRVTKKGLCLFLKTIDFEYVLRRFSCSMINDDKVFKTTDDLINHVQGG